MAKKATPKVDIEQPKKINFSFKGIEQVSFSYDTPQPPVLTSQIQFNVTLELNANPEQKLYIVKVIISVMNEDFSVQYAHQAINCFFEITNFNEVIKIKGQAFDDIPQVLLETTNSISVSTARGILFANCRGTFLHNAILPIMDPKKFNLQNIINK